MHKLTELIKNDMKPALGVTEPGAIAFAAAKAKSYVKGDIVSAVVNMNSGMYKNAFTCGIPNSEEVGNMFSVALGVVAGNAEKGLESLADVTEKDNEIAKKMIEEGKIGVKLSGITSDIFIEATVKTTTDTCVVTIKDSHTNIVKIVFNDKIIFENEKKENKSDNNKEVKEVPLIHKYTVKELLNYIKTVDIKELDFIKEAYKVNLELFEEGQRNKKTTFVRKMIEMNEGKIISKDILKTAKLLCGGAIEARVIGLDKAAMSITGSGAHGIIATMPLYAVYKVKELPEEILLRATALSYLICMYIKEYSGRLSAFCGCAIAAGTGMAVALCYMLNGTYDEMVHVINNMASSITGMICDGGNQGCTMKGIVATEAGFTSVELSMNNAYIFSEHGINGKTPEDTMRQMGLIASPGMVGTEKTIVEIFKDKLKFI